MLKNFCKSLILISFVIFFLPQSSYASEENICYGFDFPLGPPDGQGYSLKEGLEFLERWDYQGDGTKEFHPGEDWNDDNSGQDYGNDKNDKGDPVYAVGDGKIIFAAFGKESWGYVVLIEHQLAGGEKVWSQYAHMASVEEKFYKKKDTKVMRGEKIGTVGDYKYGSGKQYHLHFEIRKKYRGATDFVMNWSKEQVEEYYYNPSEFILAHRPTIAPPALNLEDLGYYRVKLTWNSSERDKIKKYEIYRATEPKGTKDLQKRTLVFQTEKSETTEFMDENLKGLTYYYALCVTYKNDVTIFSEEKSISIERTPILIEDNPAMQTYPFIANGKVFWDDGRQNKEGQFQIYYYDLAGKFRSGYFLGASGARYPSGVDASSQWIVFVTTPFGNTGQDIYALKIGENKAFKVNIVNPTYDQIYPSVSENGIVIWADMRSGSSDLYYLNLNNPTEGEQPFLVMKGSQNSPRISGDIVVWTDTRTGNRTDIYFSNIKGGEEVLVAKDVLQIRPDIWQNYITWATRNVLYLYDIKTKETKIIPTTGNITHPRINDGKIVAMNDKNLFVYDIKTQKPEIISYPYLNFGYPYYGEGYIVFQGFPTELKTAPYDIYLICYD